MSAYRDLHDELALWVQRVRHRDRIRSQRAAHAAQLQEHETRLEMLGQAALRVEKDLARLQGVSLQGLWARLIGGLGPRIDAERGHAVAARLRYAQQHQRAAGLRVELARLDGELVALGDVGAGYRAALQSKAQTLATRDDSYGRTIVELVERLAQRRGAKAEMQAAEAAGRRAIEHLRACRSTLTFLGAEWRANGVLPGLAKHDDLDAAANEAGEAQLHLQDFRTGLAQIDATLVAEPPNDSGVRFTADFVDGLIVDWMAEDKISYAKGSLDEIIGDVQRAIDALGEGVARATVEIDEMWSRFVSLVAAG